LDISIDLPVLAKWYLRKHLATEAHGITRKKNALKELFPCFSVCFRGQLGVLIFLLMTPHKARVPFDT
jgi:hypothetical protein